VDIRRERTDNRHQQEVAVTDPVSKAPREGMSRHWRVAILVAVAAVFVLVLVMKAQQSQGAFISESEAVTAQRGDAVVAFEEARQSGSPIYLLFHSMTCRPCVEISANVEQVIYDYEDKVTFVNAITDDGPARQLAARFSFQYIPTSFFIGRDGEVLGSYTGVLSPADLHARLDWLAAQ
jgi:thioredoxin-like negative regulator of GroEL